MDQQTVRDISLGRLMNSQLIGFEYVMGMKEDKVHTMAFQNSE